MENIRISITSDNIRNKTNSPGRHQMAQSVPSQGRRPIASNTAESDSCPAVPKKSNSACCCNSKLYN